MTNVGAAIIHERVGGSSQGGLHFATKGDTGAGTDIPIRMSIDKDGKVGIGTTSPSTNLEISLGNTNTADGLDLTADQSAGNSARLFFSSTEDAGNSFSIFKAGDGAASYLSLGYNATPGSSSGTNALSIFKIQAIPAFISHEPRPNNFPSFRTGLKGSVSHPSTIGIVSV